MLGLVLTTHIASTELSELHGSRWRNCLILLLKRHRNVHRKPFTSSCTAEAHQISNATYAYTDQHQKRQVVDETLECQPQPAWFVVFVRRLFVRRGAADPITGLRVKASVITTQSCCCLC